jgi:predicted permease
LADIVSLLLPFFGLILIGYIAARITKQPAEAMGWLNTFIIYAALPALFFKLVSRTPFEDLTRIDFIATDLAATYSIFIMLFVIGRWIRGNSFADSTIQSFAGAYGNIGYMGPGLALIALGEGAAVPVALIVCIENAFHFIVAPAMMAAAGDDTRSRRQLTFDIARKVALHRSSCRPCLVSLPQAFKCRSRKRFNDSSIISRRQRRHARCLPWVSHWRSDRSSAFPSRSATSCRPSSLSIRSSSISR